MKKTLIINKLTIIAIMLIILLLIMVTYYKPVEAMEINNDEYDEIFLENIVNLANENYYGDIDIIATKELLYDINLDLIGYIYNFYVNEESGYAIVINTRGYFEMSEIYFNAVSPFINVINAEYIYISNMMYLYYKDDNYYDVETNLIISLDIIEQLEDIACYSYGGTLSNSSEDVYYSSKSENKFNIISKCPGVIENTSYTNSCAAVAGANLVQFWDRYCVNLIPNYTPGFSMGNNSYLYKDPSSELDSLIGQLYNLMGINSVGIGATISQVKNGFSSYCSNAGYTVTFTSCMVNGNFNLNTAEQYISSGNPIMIFVNDLSIAEIKQNNNYDAIKYLNMVAPHILVGFGYNEITYNLSNGSTRVDKYIYVGTGLSSKPRGYYNINYNTQIIDAYNVLVA